jgi:hypothetical protein
MNVGTKKFPGVSGRAARQAGYMTRKLVFEEMLGMLDKNARRAYLGR